MALERLWAGWRLAYVTSAADEPAEDPGDDGCVFCRILASEEPPERTYVLWRGERCAALLNAYPYSSGHLMVMPRRHVADLEDLAPDEAAELWSAVTDAVRAIKAAYRPHGLNLGVNLGRPAGAGVPGHVHVHAVPRWDGDTNFMTVAAETRVLPEALPDTWSRLRAAWPS
ncbi:MAG TPA: HIT domain-containing protein [Acidimicrobiales bacterium]|jgi:ATP adenylyltransferase